MLLEVLSFLFFGWLFYKTFDKTGFFRYFMALVGAGIALGVTCFFSWLIAMNYFTTEDYVYQKTSLSPIPYWEDDCKKFSTVVVVSCLGLEDVTYYSPKDTYKTQWFQGWGTHVKEDPNVDEGVLMIYKKRYKTRWLKFVLPEISREENKFIIPKGDCKKLQLYQQ